MQILLKQSEIVDALKQYIAKQGISLAGKSVTVDFTAGRKDAGLIADITIDDIDLPRLTSEDAEDPAETAKPALAVVRNEQPAPATKEELAEIAVAEVEQQPAPKTATTSLFS